MNDALSDDKTGQALNTQRFQMLEDIAKELSGDLIFPTHFDITLRLRDLLRDSDASVQQISAAVSVEPLISSKLISVANSALYDRGGPPVRDVKGAIQRLGMKVVRSTAFGVAMKQLLLAKEIADFGDLSKGLWKHSISSAAACTVIARHFKRFKEDEAMLAGLVHDLGASYMLYRASQYEELRARPETARYLIWKWHESIGESLLHALGLPDEIAAATRDHDHPRQVTEVPRSLADVVYLGNLMAGGHFEWLNKDFDAADVKKAELGEPYASMQDEVTACTKELQAVFG
jgi:HD-like signal output (HDOD) protein